MRYEAFLTVPRGATNATFTSYADFVAFFTTGGNSAPTIASSVQLQVRTNTTNPATTATVSRIRLGV